MKGMRRHRLGEFTKGWFIGNFNPSILKSSEVEVGVKFFEAGSLEPVHHQLTATEVSVLIFGRVRMGNIWLEPGDIVEIAPGIDCDFEAITDAALVVVKSPSLPDDKVLGLN